jgi:hypothetical protein
VEKISLLKYLLLSEKEIFIMQLQRVIFSFGFGFGFESTIQPTILTWLFSEIVKL